MPGERPLVSVVTPSYNTGAYIRDTIESVLAQELPRIEHIVMDGGSTDDTSAILAGYPHLHWRSEPDRGQSDALNKAFRLARGEFIGWLNADDLYEPGALRRALEYLRAHPATDAVYGDVWIIDEMGARVGRSRGGPFDLQGLLNANMVKQPGLVMRRRMLERLGGVDERFHYVMDQELWLRAGLAGCRLDYLPDAVLASFRICEGTKTAEHGAAFRAEWRGVVERALEAPPLSELSAAARHSILERNLAEHHVALMLESMAAGHRGRTLRHLGAAIGHDRRLVLNRGMWRFAALGLLGVRPDRLRKYRKQIA